MSTRTGIPRLTSPSGLRWLTGTTVLVAGMLTWLGTTESETRPALAVVASLLAIAGLAIASVKTSVEPASGLATRQTLWCIKRQVKMDSATLLNNRAGCLLLDVKSGRSFYIPVLSLTDYVEKSQSPEILRLLAGMVELHAPAQQRVVVQLLTQADFISGGGAPRHSPLAGLITNSAVTAAKLGGAAGLAD